MTARSPEAMASDTSETPEAMETRERLIAAGLEVFAERGFQDAGLRQICTRAGTNPAAVNYYFGSKQHFYTEVLVTCHKQAASRRRMPRLADDPEHPQRVLQGWIRWFLEILLENKSGPLGQLMAREMFQPTAALDELIRRSILPMHGALSEIIGALLGDVEPQQMQLSLNSVLGQCLFYKHAQPAVERLQRLVGEVPQPALAEATPEALDTLAQHVVDFSLAGLVRVRASGDGEI